MIKRLMGQNSGVYDGTVEITSVAREAGDRRRSSVTIKRGCYRDDR